MDGTSSHSQPAHNQEAHNQALQAALPQRTPAMNPGQIANQQARAAMSHQQHGNKYPDYNQSRKITPTSKIFQHFFIPTEIYSREASFRGQCRYCSCFVSGCVGITSNFVTHIKRKHPEIKLNLSRTPVLQDYPIDKMGRIVVMPQIQKVFPKSTPVEGNNPSSPIEIKLEEDSGHPDESPSQDSGQRCSPAHSESGSKWDGPTLVEVSTIPENYSPTIKEIVHNIQPKVSDTWTLSGNSVESTNQDQALWPVSLPDKSGSFTNLTTDPWTINIPNLSNSAGQKRKLSQETPPSPSYTSKQCKIAVREPPAPTRGKRMFSVPGERGVFQSQKWEDDQTKFSHVKHDILINTNNIEQFTFKSGTYSLTDEDGGCCGKQHGHVVIMWRISFRTDELYVSQALLFSDTQLYLQIRTQLEDI